MEVAATAIVSCSFPSPRRMSAPSVALRPKRSTFSIPDSLLTPSTKRNVSASASAIALRYIRSSAPPDLASHLFDERIIYLGLPLVSQVTELIVAQFLYLQWDSPEDPIYMYINSMGTTKNGYKIGSESEAFAIYDSMSYVDPPIHTLCVGNAWGEAALLLAAGSKGDRSALPSSTIMMRQPVARFQGQASVIENARDEMKHTKKTIVKILAENTGKTEEEIEQDIRRPKYFSPSEAVEYGIIDKVLYNERAPKDRGSVSSMKSATADQKENVKSADA